MQARSVLVRNAKLVQHPSVCFVWDREKRREREGGVGRETEKRERERGRGFEEHEVEEQEKWQQLHRRRVCRSPASASTRRDPKDTTNPTSIWFSRRTSSWSSAWTSWRRRIAASRRPSTTTVSGTAWISLSQFLLLLRLPELQIFRHACFMQEEAVEQEYASSK